MTPTTVLSVLLAVALGAEPEKPAELYVQDYEVNVRSTPAVKGAVAGTVRIGTACAKRAEAADGWVEVRCGEVQGFVKGELLGPGKPELAPLLAKAGDASAPAKERLDAAMRAAYLAPDDEKALDLLRTSYFDAEFEGLRAERGGEAIAREEKVRCELPTTRARCFGSALASDYELLDLELRDGDFAAFMSSAGSMYVAKGTLGKKFETAPGLGPLRVLRYRVEARSHFSASEVLTKALLRGPNAQPAHRRGLRLTIPDLETQRLTASLSEEWLLLTGAPGRRKAICYRSFFLRMSIFGEVLFHFSNGDEAPSSSGDVLSIRKSGNRYNLTILTAGEPRPRTLVIEWPGSEPSVARIDGKAYAPRESGNLLAEKCG